MKTLLIFGAAGQLGTDCTDVLRNRYRLVLLDCANLDIGDRSQCNAALEHYRPDIVLNCAAYTRVDEAESSPGLARRVNALAPGVMAEWVEARSSRLIHISTDFVFDGSKPPPEQYVEEDAPNPLSVYGLTKLEGETAIRKETDRYAILRTAWLYGRTGANFPKTMLRLALNRAGQDIRVVDDQLGSPTWSWRLAQQIARILETDARGLFHASSDHACTWHELACAFLDAMNVPHRIVPCSTADYPTPALRPPNAVLRNRALQEAGLDLMPDWREDLTMFASANRETLINETRENP